jgi:hypothetical protein
MRCKYLVKTLLILFTVSIISCKKNGSETPSFDVKMEKNVFKSGDPVAFTFTGNAESIDFYSGEFGNDYAYLDGRVLDVKLLSLYFQTRVINGTQKNQFSVFVSSDFNGKYDIASIKAATWREITNSFNIATGSDYVNSGEVDIASSVTDRTKPLYVAFRYVVQPQTIEGTQRNWYVRNLLLNATTDLGTNILIDQQTAAWTLVEDGKIVEPGRSFLTPSTGILTFRGNSTTEGKATYTEAWAISKPVSLDQVDLGPDKGVPIKGITDNMPAVYTHTYSEPGVYQVVFAASNPTFDKGRVTLKKRYITIEP